MRRPRGIGEFLAPVLLFGTLLVLASAGAQESPHPPSACIAQSWHKEDGLPHETVEAVLQTRDGYLWFGTQRGLARFNGAEFKVFDAQNTPQLKNSHITGLWEDTTGALWVGTTRGGLTRFSEGRCERYDFENGGEAWAVRGLAEGPKGLLWVGTGAGVYALEQGRFHGVLEQTGRPPGYVRTLCSDQQGGFWLGTASSGVCHVRNGEVVASYSVTNGLTHSSVRALHLARSGTLWVGTMLGVSGLRPDGTFTYYGPTNGLSSRIVTALYEDHQGMLWIGTQSGLHYVAQGRLYTEVQANGAAYDSVNALAEDVEGNLWVATGEGVYRLRPRKFRTYTTQQGLPHNNVTAVMEDQAGTVWFATWGGGVCKLENGTLSTLTRKEGLVRDLILSLGQDEAGTMWAGSDLGGGLMHLVPNAPRVRQSPSSTPGTVRVFYEDRQRHLWVGTAAGLYRWQPQPPTRYTVRDGLAYDIVRSLTEDHADNLWVGTTHGLSCLSNGNFQTFPHQQELTNRVIYALFEDSARNLWLGTDNGLVRLRGGSLRSYTTREGLFSDEVFSVLEAAGGTLWMSCPNGVFSVARTNLDALDAGKTEVLRCVSYDKHDGLPTTQCSGVGQPAAWKGKDGRLWFTTLHGAAVIAPASVAGPNDRVPPVFIEECLVDKRHASERPQGSGEVRFPLTQTPTALSFAPGRGELEFHYAALSFQVPEKNRFRYQLEGVDPQWVEAEGRRVAYYNNVPPGSYRFRVQAANNDGRWNATGACLDLLLLPHFWQTWWFRALLGVGLVGMVAGTVRYFEQGKTRRQLHQLEIARATEQERTRIARDIHDDLGARLTKISKLSEQAERELQATRAGVQVRTIHATAQEMLSQLDETVWAVNPRNDRLDRLADYLLHYAEEFFRHTDIRCRLKVIGEVAPLPVPAETRHHLFLAVKEALNNAARHSGATEVQLRIEYSGRRFRVSVIDDGRGFNAQEGLAHKRGLENMRARLAQLGGHWELETQPGRGTTVQLELQTQALPPHDSLPQP
jgi:ligand-binding sensor domain-containing protein/signal transduction histidine kinase